MVLRIILDITDRSNFMDLHKEALKVEASKENIKEWCKDVKECQTKVIQLLRAQGKPHYINMYKMFTTPFYCYVMYDINIALRERYKTLFSMLFEIIEKTDNFGLVVRILMSDIHLFLDISTSIFRLLFNDGMLLSSMLRHQPTTIKTGCRVNTLELIKEQILKEFIVVCLGCGEQIYQVEVDASKKSKFEKKK